MIELGGEDRIAFLQGLVSNDVTQARPGRAVWAALLTPQGKWLADFFIFADARTAAAGLRAGPGRDADATPVALPSALQGDAARGRRALRLRCLGWRADSSTAIAAPDPRLPEAGWRLLSATPLPTTALRGGLGSPPAGTRPARRAHATWKRRRPCCWKQVSMS